jgi:ribokinase
VPSVSTGVAGISVDEAGQNSIIVVPGANSEVRASDVDQAIGEFDPRVVLAQLEIPLEVIEALAARKFQAGSHWKFVLNPAPFQPLSDRTLAAVDVITPNEHEAHALTGIFPVDESACKKAADTLLAKGVGAVVLTLGERGVYVASAGDAFFIGAHDVKVVDTTAAGDAFSGALAWFLALGWKLRLAAWHANLVAALSTTRRGAQDSMPSLKAYEQAAALIT